MKLRTRILAGILIIGLPLQMCTNNDDDCNCSPVAPFFDITGVVSSHLKKESGNNAEVLDDGDSVLYENYIGLNTGYEADFISSNYFFNTSDFSLIPSAYACSCIQPGHSGSKNEMLVNLTVITLNDFDETHLANTTINDIVQIEEFLNFGFDVSEDAPYIPQYLENQTSNISSQVFRLKVDRKPSLNQNFKVKVIVELSTGEIYETISETIILL